MIEDGTSLITGDQVAMVQIPSHNTCHIKAQPSSRGDDYYAEIILYTFDCPANKGRLR